MPSSGSRRPCLQQSFLWAAMRVQSAVPGSGHEVAVAVVLRSTFLLHVSGNLCYCSIRLGKKQCDVFNV